MITAGKTSAISISHKITTQRKGHIFPRRKDSATKSLTHSPRLINCPPTENYLLYSQNHYPFYKWHELLGISIAKDKSKMR